MYGKLKGYKTFIVAGLAIVAALLGYLDGDLSKQQAGQLVLNAALGITLRDALNTTVGKIIERAVLAALVSRPTLPPVAVQPVAPPAPAPEPQVQTPSTVDALVAVERLLAEFRQREAARGA